jgi:hypothetical protein
MEHNSSPQSASVATVDGVETAQGNAVQPMEADRAQFAETAAAGQPAWWFEDDAGWNEEENEVETFNAYYDEAAAAYFEDAVGTNAQGRQVLRLLSYWKPVVAGYVRNVLHNTESIDDALDATLDWEPEGRSQAMLRPIQEDTFASATYFRSPTSVGEETIVDDDTMESNQQGIIIIGYADFAANGVSGYDYIQEDVSDSIGTRRRISTKLQTETDDAISVINRLRGPLPVYPGDSVTISQNVYETGIRNGLWPLGFEVLNATATDYGGILD